MNITLTEKEKDAAYMALTAIVDEIKCNNLIEEGVFTKSELRALERVKTKLENA